MIDIYMINVKTIDVSDDRFRHLRGSNEFPVEGSSPSACELCDIDVDIDDDEPLRIGGNAGTSLIDSDVGDIRFDLERPLMARSGAITAELKTHQHSDRPIKGCLI